MNNAKIGAALLGGYVLGRTKKAKAAISLGALLAGSRIRPGQVGKTLQESPLVHNLTDQVRTELTGAGKAAATAVLTAKADHLAEALHQRTAGLREKAPVPGERDTGRGEEAEDEQETEEETEPEETEPDEEADEEPPEEEPQEDEPREEAPRSAGRAKTQRGKSGKDEEPPRKRKTSTSQSRSRSGGATRSRRQDDG